VVGGVVTAHRHPLPQTLVAHLLAARYRREANVTAYVCCQPIARPSAIADDDSAASSVSSWAIVRGRRVFSAPVAPFTPDERH
jgi:hypothetical protein